MSKAKDFSDDLAGVESAVTKDVDAILRVVQSRDERMGTALQEKLGYRLNLKMMLPLHLLVTHSQHQSASVQLQGDRLSSNSQMNRSHLRM